MEDIEWMYKADVEQMDPDWNTPFTHSHQAYYALLGGAAQIYLDEDGKGQWYFSCCINGIYIEEFIPVSGTPEEMQAVAIALWRMR